MIGPPDRRPKTDSDETSSPGFPRPASRPWNRTPCFPDIFSNAALKLVGTGLRCGIEHSSRAASKLRAVVAGFQLELCDRLWRRREVVPRSIDVIAVHIVVVDAVQLIVASGSVLPHRKIDRSRLLAQETSTLGTARATLWLFRRGPNPNRCCRLASTSFRDRSLTLICLYIRCCNSMDIDRSSTRSLHATMFCHLHRADRSPLIPNSSLVAHQLRGRSSLRQSARGVGSASIILWLRGA